MADIKISVINASTVVTDEEVEKATTALQTQVSEHFAPIWGNDADLTFVRRQPAEKDTSWWLVILDTSDVADALGYHDFTPAGRPIGKVFAQSDLLDNLKWTVTASHELLEMLADPDIVRTVFVQETNTSGEIYAYEVCDACEADASGYTISIGGGEEVLVSDFVYPTWFEPSRRSGSTKFDYQGKITKPFELLEGGYIGIFTVGSGSGWHQKFASAEDVRTLKLARARVGSRRERRRIPRDHWRKSEPDWNKLSLMKREAESKHLALR